MSRRTFGMPQFGFLTLFAAMLLFVSAAGWFRFQYDLYREEEEILAAFGEAGFQVISHRHDLVSFEGEPFYRHWLGVPYFDRIRTLGVSSSSSSTAYPAPEPPRELVERAARLPFLESFNCSVGGSLPQRYPDSAPISAPPRPEAETVDVDEPLPTGERLGSSEAEELLRSWRAAWASPVEMPYGTQRVRRTDVHYGPLPSASMPPEYFSDDTIVAYGPGGAMWCSSGRLDLTNRLSYSSLQLEEGRFVEGNRYSGSFADYYFDERALGFSQSATGRAPLQNAFRESQAMDRWEGLVEGTSGSDLDQAHRIDDLRHRIDFAPLSILRDDGKTEDELLLSVVVLAEEDYPIESWDLLVRRVDTSGLVPASETRFAWRGRLGRHADRWLVDAASSEAPSMSHPASPRLTIKRDESYLVAYDFEVPPDSAFQREAWNAVEFPDPRPLPFWRWYRATFAISVVLLGYVAVRRIASRFGRHRDRDTAPSADASSTAPSETDEALTG